MIEKLKQLTITLDGHVEWDNVTRIAYSTDASAYCEMPLAVVFPKTKNDIIELVKFANRNNITIIPRAAGTSLAGQVVGSGLVVDVSRYMTKILKVNQQERWVELEPGVVLDELNMYLKEYGLFFAPETSTSNRCCVGGMLGNNSCGSHSLRYGSTRDHILSAEVVLSDGSVVEFKDIEKDEIYEKCGMKNIEGDIYSHIYALLSDKNNRELLEKEFPSSGLKRRNNGYALDLMMYNNVFDSSDNTKFNLCKLLAGSEGTLAFTTKMRLNLELLPPRYKAVMCMHCSTLEESFDANLIALKHEPVAVELIDDKILHLSEKNISQRANRFFIDGDPAAILIIELAEETEALLNNKLAAIENDMRILFYGYAYPVLRDKDIQRVWDLRKAGLGLLANMLGSAKPVPVIEDTAVEAERLPAFMKDIEEMLRELNLECVHYAHIATGELHLRPILNLKEEKDRALFRKVAIRTAHIVKKHNGSLSGEHGDGRLRGEFIPIMFGNDVYEIFKELKRVFDPNNIFNKGKITDTPPMDECFRNENRPSLDKLDTYFDFSSQNNFINAVEQCNGAGDCRKSIKFTGVLCPSFKSTGKETYTTRARANIMRAVLYNFELEAFANKDVLSVLHDCLSCKACKSECPSSVDMTKLKAEFLQHHYKMLGVPWHTKLIASMPQMYALAQIMPSVYNFFATNRTISNLIKQTIGFAKERSLPQLANHSLISWFRQQKQKTSDRKLYFFIDEFTNHLDVEIGKTFVRLMWNLGYEVIVPKHVQSGRTAISKGLLKQAKVYAHQNVMLLCDIVSEDIPLVGLEPSTILSFRDEYIDLLYGEMKTKAIDLAKNVMLYDEFILREIEKGHITQADFIKEKRHIMLHGHCHQKSLASVVPSKKILELPLNYSCDIIPSGCCGMAGSYGYEADNYAKSIGVAEGVLLPAIRKTENTTIISAPGTSCRTQIHDGTGRIALHPVEVLYEALK